MKQRIHLFGASGSGTTTIAKGVCDAIRYKHFDSDDYFWLPTGDPFTMERPRDDCLDLLKSDLLHNTQWVLSGSLTGWGDALVSLFDLVVFVYVPQDVRLERLQKREFERYDERVLSGGNRCEDSQAFLEWAAAYDAGTRNGRSLAKHERWLDDVACSVLRINNHSLEDSVHAVLKAIQQ